MNIVEELRTLDPKQPGNWPWFAKIGALVLQERLDKTPPWHAVVAVGALCLALLGAVVISSARVTLDEADQRVSEVEPAPAQPSLG